MDKILSILIFLPLMGALILGVAPEKEKGLVRMVSLGTALLTFLVSLVVYGNFKHDTFKFQMVEKADWIKELGIGYHIGVDGHSIWLLLLTTFLMVVAAGFSWYVENRVKSYYMFLLILECAMLGVFVSLDMMLFFAFFEATLIPMYFLINIWGGSNRAYAAIKFFLYTAAGSILMLLAMIMLYVISRDVTGTGTFDIVQIQAMVASGQFWTEKWMAIQGIMLGAFLLAFMIKVPMFPFHTWLPDAHVEAPTAGSVILAGVLLKMGTYGIIRFCLPIFPDALPMYVVPISVLAVVGILYGGIVAAVQPDLKKLVAYSSVAHMGFILLGIFSLDHAGLMGGSLQQLNHGVSTGALFLLIGLLYERRHTRMFKDFGGLKAQMPIYATLFLIIMLSSVGLPATNGFVGEFLALMGSFNSGYTGMYGLNIILTAVAATGVIVAAVYLLKMFMQVFYGPNTNPENQRLKDLKPWETVMVGSFVVLVFVGGLLPNVFMKPMEASVQAARLMATKPAGERPAWADESVEVSSKGEIVRALKTAEVPSP